ncbi:MAG TPA: histidine phosphatase family protein [Beijerinckiaceae bacterium]|jgi:probable phosphoglycerate mutase
MNAIPPRPFLFLRHGETDWNREGRFQGATDVPLNEAGLAQAQAAAERIAGQSVTAVVTSPLVRASKTAEIVAARLECPVHVDHRLAERSFGRFEGRIVREVKRELGVGPGERLADLGLLPPDAEPWPATVARTSAVVAKWLDLLPSDRLLFVSHLGLFEALCHDLCGSRFEGRHAVPYLFRPAGEGWRVDEIG